MADNLPTATQAQIDAQIAAVKKAEDEIAAEKKAEVSPIQYTLFASGISNGGRYGDFADKNTVDDVALVFDVVDTHTYSKSFNKTSYAVESKVKISDHVTTEDGKFSFSARVTDSPLIMDKRNYLDKDTDPDNPRLSKRPAKALEILETIANAHHLVTLVTEDNILSGYVITDFSLERASGEGGSVVFNITLEEFRFRMVGKTVLMAANADPKKAGTKSAGAKQTAEGGKTEDELKGKRSPYLSKQKGTFETWEHDKIGTTYDDAQSLENRTIKPGQKFDPKNITTGGKP